MKHKTAFKPIVISIVLSILLITTAVFFARHHNSIPSINTDFLQQEITEPEEPSPQIVQSARNQIGKTLHYDPAYTKLTYPMGDVPILKGVCTDVIIRALRDQNIDLQALVHQDMSQNFSVYPKRWGLTQPDTNIDHRRVPNLMTYFTRQGWAVQDTNYQAGDIVTWELKGNRPHIGIVSDLKIGDRPLIIHNIGSGTRENDILYRYTITGHYRLPVR
jgi:NADH:ubiquinone oxidoreductase, na